VPWVTAHVCAQIRALDCTRAQACTRVRVRSRARTHTHTHTHTHTYKPSNARTKARTHHTPCRDTFCLRDQSRRSSSRFPSAGSPPTHRHLRTPSCPNHCTARGVSQHTDVGSHRERSGVGKRSTEVMQKYVLLRKSSINCAHKVDWALSITAFAISVDAHTYTHARAHTHTHARAHAHAHTHTHTHTRARARARTDL
jgi:hypothetical protein